MPEVGENVTAGEESAVVESVKAAGDVKAPISGKVTEINTRLTDTPELVNESPESDGWLYKISPEDTAGLEELMDADAYQKFVKSLE